VEKPQGFETHDMEMHVCRFKKALYGLKQAPREWYGWIDGFLMSLGFTKRSADPNLYFKVEDDGPVILLLYFDDLFLTGVENHIIECKIKLTIQFEMKYLGFMHYFLGLEVWQRKNEIFLNQGKYVVEILKRFGMLDCKPMATPMASNMKLLDDMTSYVVDATLYRKMIGSLMYLKNTRPYICFAMNTLSQYMVDPKCVHLLAVKHVMMYLKGTMDYGLKYVADSEISLLGYSYLDSVGSVANQKSTLGC
jgi:hypothetical protein